MSKRIFGAAAVAVMALACATNANAITVHTSSFIGTTDRYAGFEGTSGVYDGAAGYSEDGVLLKYISPSSDPTDTEIWADSHTGQAGIEGSHAWYSDGANVGYTRITLSDFSDMSAIQFLAGSGGGSGKLYFQVLNNGNVLLQGLAGNTPGYGGGFSTFGFDGGVFDEVRLQVDWRNAELAFSTNMSDAGAYDGIRITAGGGGVVPEPGTWALMITGFGAAGAMLRRRQVAAV